MQTITLRTQEGVGLRLGQGCLLLAERVAQIPASMIEPWTDIPPLRGIIHPRCGWSGQSETLPDWSRRICRISVHGSI
ncbi:hypothetical protein ACC674_38750, partial [Rhizobium ruizarguesonis]